MVESTVKGVFYFFLFFLTPPQEGIWYNTCMNIFKNTAVASGGVLLMIVFSAIRFVAYFITPFALLTLGRAIYCHFSDVEFSILWSIRGAVFLAAIGTLLIVANIAHGSEGRAENSLKAIPARMVLALIFVFLLQVVWHGFKCFFSEQEFLLIDKAWLGDLLAGLIVAVCVAIWSLLKYAFTRR